MATALPDFENVNESLRTRGGVLWFEAPAPGFRHAHEIWTLYKHRIGWLARCTCGALSDGGKVWSARWDRKTISDPLMDLEAEFSKAVVQAKEAVFSELELDHPQAKLAIRLLNMAQESDHRNSIDLALKDDCTVETFENADGTWHYRAAYRGMILQGSPQDAASYIDEPRALRWGNERCRAYLFSEIFPHPTPYSGGY